jgi:hypothetical protein
MRRTQVVDLSEKDAKMNIWARTEEVMGGWRKLYYEELHNMCLSPYIFRGIESRRMR